MRDKNKWKKNSSPYLGFHFNELNFSFRINRKKISSCTFGLFKYSKSSEDNLRLSVYVKEYSIGYRQKIVI